MKTKLIIILTVFFGFTSCIKDYIGNGSKDVILTAENHLSSGDLFVQYADEEIVRLDNIIGSPNDYSDVEIEAAKKERETLKIQIANTLNIYSVFDIPRPCPNDPGGKCVPSRLEYFIFRNDVQKAVVKATTENGKIEGLSDELKPLPGFESDLQFIRVPIENIESSLTLELVWKDSKGNLKSIKVNREN